MTFRLVPKSVTLNDLEWRNGRYFSLSHRVRVRYVIVKRLLTRRPASADRTACRQFQATGQPVSQMQASDAMTSRLPCYEAKCVQCRCFQRGSVPLRSDIKGTERPPIQYIDTTRKAIDCATTLPLTVFI